MGLHFKYTIQNEAVMSLSHILFWAYRAMNCNLIATFVVLEIFYIESIKENELLSHDSDFLAVLKRI